MSKFPLYFTILIVIIVVLPADTPLPFLLSVGYIGLIGSYNVSRHSFFYIHSRSNTYLPNESMSWVFLISSSYTIAIAFLIGAMILIAQIINLIYPLTLQDFLNTTWLYAVAFLISGIVNILFFNILQNVTNPEFTRLREGGG